MSWSEQDAAQAAKEGWGLFKVDGKTTELQKLDDSDIFDSDEEARKFVTGKAKEDPEGIHSRALACVIPFDRESHRFRHENDRLGTYGGKDNA